MNILWLTARTFGSDLAGTMETGLLNSLADIGVDVTLISPGEVNNDKINHFEINKIEIPGLKTLSGARDLKYILKNKINKKFDSIMIDWRYVYSLRRFLIETSVPWYIVDRGPPANIGLLKKLQKWFWKRAWEIANDHSTGGFAVSNAHRNFIKNLVKVNMDIKIISAGTGKNNFLSSKVSPKEIINLVYVGTLDSRRGLGKIFTLSDNLKNSEINHKIIICGRGNMEKEFSDYSSLDENYLSYMGDKSHEDILKLLANSHIGIMPMPNIPIWRIASPLKLMEYMAAGLLIIGPKHDGNQIDNQATWNLLSNHDWPKDAVHKITSLTEHNWQDYSNHSLNASKNFLWSEISRSLINDINS